MDALGYVKELVAFESPSYLSNVEVTNFCQHTLRELGFATERVEFDDDRGVAKACVIGKRGSGPGGLAYFGHTDVVPADDWFSDEHGPFSPTVVGDKLYGRGSCDMKGSVACMLAAAKRFAGQDLKHPVYITCTADEEIGYGGARQVAKRSELFQEMVAGNSHGIIGEPTMLEVVHAHKGTCGLVATSRGRAAHSSTRAGVNANLAMIPFLGVMKEIHDETVADAKWQNDEFDPPVLSWNIGINDQTRAINITAPQSICTIYFRPMPGIDYEPLIERVQQAADANGVELAVNRSSKPLYIDSGSPYVQEMLKLTGQQKSKTVSYGTDGGVLTALKNLVVCGPGDIVKAHTNDEWIELDQLTRGEELYAKLIEHYCC